MRLFILSMLMKRLTTNELVTLKERLNIEIIKRGKGNIDEFMSLIKTTRKHNNNGK